MVMDVTPSPQSVGREFVRQYYTLLNKAPDHLHRFYNTNSSFVHGGLDVHNREAVMVIGQKQIFAKIKQLKFRDCHAKISQVDAQSTLGNGVVVQVTGELSNDGQPMRRFTQTFVLAMQTPKKYYVHNDIFRYQDLYSEEEAELENGGTGGALNGETAGEQQQQLVDNQLQQQQQLDGSGNVVLDGQLNQLQQQQQQIYYPVAGAADLQAGGNFVQLNGGVAKPQQDVNALQQQQQQQQQHLAAQQQAAAVHQQQLQQQQQQADAEIAVAAAAAAQLSLNDNSNSSNANHHQQQQHGNTDTTNNDTSYDRTTLSSSEQENSVEDQQQQQQHSTAAAEAIVEAATPVAAVREELVAPAAAPAVVTPAPKLQPAEPKTYANLFKTDVSFAAAMANAPALGSSSNSGAMRYGLQRSEARPAADAGQTGRTTAAAAVSRPVRSQERRPSNTAAQQQHSQTAPQQQFGDNQQLFLGNVPHHATEEELTQLFSKFGTVVDLRIHSKPGQKLPGGRAPPHYGFITYDDPEAVQNCLAHMPLYYPENSPDGQKLNVEEKKTRMRSDNGPSSASGPRGGDMGRNLGSNANSNGSGVRLGGNGPRGGAPSGGGGMMRGAPIGGSGGSGGPRSGGAPGSGNRGAFNRNDNRGGPATGGPQRGGAQTAGGGGGVGGGGSNSNYGRR